MQIREAAGFLWGTQKHELRISFNYTCIYYPKMFVKQYLANCNIQKVKLK